jgi:hypothetical protein
MAITDHLPQGVNYDRPRIPPHVERWLAAHYERNRLSRLLQQNSAEMAEIKLTQFR